MLLPSINFGGGAARLFYRSVDISSEIAPMVISINYTDHFHGEADEIDVTVHDEDGRWKGSWFPEHGDVMELYISDDGFTFIPCGRFELDEPNVQGSRGGDTMTMRGLAAPITKAMRTENTTAYEEMMLSTVVQETVSRTGLTLEGNIDDLFFKRITQRKETDLEFLKRLAEETGHYFTVRGSRAVFTNYQSVDGRAPPLIIHLEDKARDNGPLIDYNLSFQSTETYSKGSAQYADPDKKAVTKAEMMDDRIMTGDELKIRGERIESEANAMALLKAEMHMANRKHKQGSITMIGNTKALAGSTIGVVGFGRYDDRYVIDASSHALSRSGYTTSVEMKVAAQG